MMNDKLNVLNNQPENLSLLAQQQVCLREPNLTDLVQTHAAIEFLSALSIWVLLPLANSSKWSKSRYQSRTRVL
jgi:hypothetical protein